MLDRAPCVCTLYTVSVHEDIYWQLCLMMYMYSNANKGRIQNNLI